MSVAMTSSVQRLSAATVLTGGLLGLFHRATIRVGLPLRRRWALRRAPPAAPVAPLTAPVAAPQVATSPAGSFVAVSFLPTLTAADISVFLKAYDVTVADGPNADGMYRIRLSNETLPPAEVQRIIASMRTQAAFVSVVKES